MNSEYRRYEFLLPKQFNDGQPVPAEHFADTLLDLRSQFGAVSAKTQIIHGSWQHQDREYRDELIRVFVDVPDTDDTAAFFRDFKDRLKERFRQLDIWMASHPVEVI